ncbi:MAG: hypothetical protein ACREP9_09045, partial [Candidatus Dormibacteraceae bacterium]
MNESARAVFLGWGRNRLVVMRRLLEGFGLLLVLVTLTTKLAAAAPLPPENSWWRLSALPESGQGAV